MVSVEAYNKSQPPVTIETGVFSEDNIAAGEEIFKSNYVCCHLYGGKEELVLT